MRQILLVILFLATSLLSYGQAYLGKTTKQVNFREGPGTDYSIISSLQPGAQLFIISLETEDDFYKVIHIASNKTGYVHKSFVKIEKELAENKEGIFSPNGESETFDPEIEIYNKTSKTLTLLLNTTTYTFTPHEKKKLTLAPGNYVYIASAPGVIPDYGKEAMQNNMSYSWTFYIETIRR